MTPMRRSQNWLPYVFNDLFDNDWMIKRELYSSRHQRD